MNDSRLHLLVIDDDDLVASSIRLALPSQWRMTHSSEAHEVPLGSFNAALVDIHLSGRLNRSEGLEIIAKLREKDPHLEIIAFSGDLDRDLMEASLRSGASRFLSKPLYPEELCFTLDKIEALYLLRDASARRPSGTPGGWVGSSTQSEDVRRAIASLRGEPGPILIEGESGTGKEVAAQLLHVQSGPSRPFIAVNVATLPENVFESEFFGHVKGAFTGADQNKMGLAEAAHGGDLFLDEIEALPLAQQAKLLRFLETGEIRRVGGKESIRVNVRVISATNQNLEAMVEGSSFRNDLFHRLNGRKLQLPALRDRPEDIMPLANYFLEAQRPRRNKTFATDAASILNTYHWPGNVRELKHTVEQLALHAPLPLIRAEDIMRQLPRTTQVKNERIAIIDLNRGLAALLAAYEADLIRLSLEKSPDIDAAAHVLGISRSSLYKKIKDYGIQS